jgi:hypothetical protein
VTAVTAVKEVALCPNCWAEWNGRRIAQSFGPIKIDLDNFVRRLLVDTLQNATAEWWKRRARDFEQVGNAECDEIARACRNHAELLSGRFGPLEEVDW